MPTIYLTCREWYFLHVLLDKECSKYPDNHIIKNIINELDQNKPLVNDSTCDFKTEYKCEWIGDEAGYIQNPKEIEEHTKQLISEYKNELNDIPIEELKFSVLTYSCLKRAGIKFKSDIEKLSENDILKIRNISTARLKEIKEKVNLERK
jgi:DNA-directed RNA polymerase alpha subunit